MDTLLNPDTGLVIWTVATFLCLVFLLAKFAWKPLLSAIEEREAGIKSDVDRAQAARADSERIKAELDAKLAGLEAQGREMLALAQKEGEALRQDLRSAAEADARKIKERTAAELAEEKRRLVSELRQEVATLSVLAAEKLVRKSVDESVRKSVLDSFFKDLEKQKAN